MDVHSEKIRSKNMSAIRSQNTKPELKLRHALHKMGFRYRLYSNKIIGKPDMVFKRFNAVVFVNGCFWHKHDCSNFQLPKSRVEFWQKKLEGNKSRDQNVLSVLQSEGWRIAVVWECALKGRGQPEKIIAGKVANWLQGRDSFIELPEVSNAG